MISIVISTFGDGWVSKNIDKFHRALQSALSQTIPVDVVWEHGPTLAQARNRGARHAKGDRLVFLDADDRLELDYAAKVVESEDILQPKTVYIDGEDITEPFWIPPREDFLMGNHIVIGAPVNRELFLDSGGFEPYHIAEDWALWLKLRQMGATFGKTEATYIVNVNHNGINSKPDYGVYDEIRRRFA